jgi:hypothetical protein
MIVPSHKGPLTFNALQIGLPGSNRVAEGMVDAVNARTNVLRGAGLFGQRFVVRDGSHAEPAG